MSSTQSQVGSTCEVSVAGSQKRTAESRGVEEVPLDLWNLRL